MGTNYAFVPISLYDRRSLHTTPGYCYYGRLSLPGHEALLSALVHQSLTMVLLCFTVISQCFTTVYLTCPVLPHQYPGLTIRILPGWSLRRLTLRPFHLFSGKAVLRYLEERPGVVITGRTVPGKLVSLPVLGSSGDPSDSLPSDVPRTFRLPCDHLHFPVFHPERPFITHLVKSKLRHKEKQVKLEDLFAIHKKQTGEVHKLLIVYFTVF